MEKSTKLNFGFISQYQAQKEIIFNENFAKLDNILYLSFISREIATVPSNPAYGDCYLIPKESKGEWANSSEQIAYYKGMWEFIIPKPGMIAWIQAEKKLVIFDGNIWKGVILE